MPKPMKPKGVSIQEISRIPYPIYGTPKFDGQRCLTTKSGLYSSSNKRLPNEYLQAALSLLPPGMDGELIAYENGQPLPFRKSGWMRSILGSGDFRYHIFDNWLVGSTHPYRDRLNEMIHTFGSTGFSYCPEAVHVKPTLLHTWDEAVEYLKTCLDQGYEGAVYNKPNAYYLQKKSTSLLYSPSYKIKPFLDADAVVTSIIPLQRNLNDPQINELGFCSRSSAQSGKVSDTLMGSLVCKGIEEPFLNVTFNLGTGFDLGERQSLFDNPPIGKTLAFKYQPDIHYDSPRHPVFLHFKD